MLFLGRGFDPARKDEEKAELEDLLQARDKKFHLSPIITSQIASPARRRRSLLLLFVFLFWILAGRNSIRGTQPSRSPCTGDSSVASSIFAGQEPLRQGLFSPFTAVCPPPLDVRPDQIYNVKEDEAYLDPEHLKLPRRKDPYIDINQWTKEKKERAVRGLDWLIAHVNDRWSLEPGWRVSRTRNQAVYTRLRKCLRESIASSSSTCSSEDMTVILLGSYRFGAVHAGQVSGENIWARSAMDAFEEIGCSMVYAFDNAEIYEIHRAIPDLVQIVIAEARGIRACHEFGRREWAEVLSPEDIEQGALVTNVEAESPNDHQVRNYTLDEWTQLPNRRQQPTFYGHPPLRGQRFSDAPDALDPQSPNFEPHEEWRCAQAPDFPQGIPLWKMFAFHFWVGTDLHPLGAQWTMSPEPYSTFPGLSKNKEFNMYMGYSIEAYCGDNVPAEERKHRAYVLAKKENYLLPPLFALSDNIFDSIKNETGLEFVAGIGKPDSAFPDPGITNIGFQTIPGFLHQLGQSKALVGVGRPFLSPTPYDALCMGVPFINPILSWDMKDPDDKTKWNPQHGGVSEFGEPYVYNVKRGNEIEIKSAIAQAIATPIESFIPRRMTKAAVRARYRLLVEADWKAVYDERFGKEGFRG